MRALAPGHAAGAPASVRTTPLLIALAAILLSAPTAACADSAARNERAEQSPAGGAVDPVLPAAAYITRDDRACGLTEHDVIVAAGMGTIALAPDRPGLDPLLSCLVDRRRFAPILAHSLNLEEHGRIAQAYLLDKRVAARILGSDAASFARTQRPSSWPTDPFLSDAARQAIRLHERRDFDVPREELAVWREIQSR